MPSEIPLRNMSSAVFNAKDVRETKMLDTTTRETPDTVTDDNPSKEYITGSGKPPMPLGNKGRPD